MICHHRMSSISRSALREAAPRYCGPSSGTSALSVLTCLGSVLYATTPEMNEPQTQDPSSVPFASEWIVWGLPAMARSVEVEKDIAMRFCVYSIAISVLVGFLSGFGAEEELEGMCRSRPSRGASEARVLQQVRARGTAFSQTRL